MTTGFSNVDGEAARGEGACVAGASIADVLRLLGSGATGAILMALGEGPLRTKALTESVPGYTKRTVYRYAGKLADLEVIEREEGPGVPSKVVHSLTEGCGRELYELVDRFAHASMAHLPDGRIDAHAWAALGLLADLWETGMVEELSCDPKSPTELARGPHGLSYHQVNRRAGLFETAGLVSGRRGPGRRRYYVLTEKTRRAMGLVIALARWRQRHAVAEDEEGMTTPELATALRAALPLVKVPAHAGKRLRLCVVGESGSPGPGEEAVWAEIEDDGAVQSCIDPEGEAHGWSRGRVEAWILAVMDGEPRRVSVGGEDEGLVADCLARLHDVLWVPETSDGPARRRASVVQEG